MIKKFKHLIVMMITLFSVSCGSSSGGSTEDSLAGSSHKVPGKVPEGYTKEVDGLVFDELEEFPTIYNYAPSVFEEDGVAHVYYCSNPGSGQMGDQIAYRRGVEVNKEWYWSPKQFVLLRGEKGEWDSGNVCDPDVIKGVFRYNDVTYHYLMTYLGCETIDNSANSFGFAVSNAPEGPWIKVESLNPLYDFYEKNPGYVYKPGINDFIWGTGQSALISVDKKGRVLLFYTGGSTTGQRAERWDFSNLNKPIKEYAADISNNGIRTLDNKVDVITNAHLIYDPDLEMFYMLSDTHPWSEHVWPTNLPYSTRVSSVSDFASIEIGDCFQKSNLTWNTIELIGEQQTGFKRVHNTCFYRDEYGHVLKSNDIEVFYTMSLEGNDWKVLFTYRIYRYKVNK